MKLQQYDINEQRLQIAIDSGVDKATRRRPVRRVALVAALALALSLGTVATARYLGSIGWDGREKVETQYPGQPTVVPTEPPILSALDDDAYEIQVDALLAEKPDFAYWFVMDRERGGEGGRHGESSERIPSMAQGAARVRKADMRIWDGPPAGYAFDSFEIWFYFTERDFAETVLTSDEAVTPRITVKQYAPPESIRDQIARYRLELSDEAGHSIVLSADLEESSTEYGFGIQEGASYEPLEIPGMAHALYHSYAKDPARSLHMLQADMTPREFSFFFNFEDPAPETMVYDRIRYEIYADGLSRAEMIALAEALR